MDDLGRLILAHEEWLTDRVVHYARQGGHAAYTSTLREAWRASVAQLSKPVLAALADMAEDGTPRPQALAAAADYCLEQAQRHRDRGIDLDMFLGLLVFYRRSYFDLVEEHPATPADRRRMLVLLMEIFDAIELRLVRDMVERRATDGHKRLQARNRALVNEKNKYLTVFESLAEPTILLDRDDAPLHMNAAGHRILLGDDAPGLGYYGTPDLGRLRSLLGAVLARIAGQAEDREGITLQTARGPRVFSIASREMLDISGKFGGRVILLRDVTDYRAATEAAKDAERAKSALLAMFSHEIRTPINSILALTRLMDDPRLAPEQHRHLARLRESGRVLSDLVENILGLSRAEAGALRRLDQEFDLRELIRSVMLTVEPAAAAKGLEIVCDIAGDVPGLLHGDMQKLRHILMNLLSNAVGFTARGRVSLRVALDTPAERGRCRLRFEVSDTGPGLPPGGAEWLFEPFAQYHHRTAEEGRRGSGLGLAICREFVSFLGGSIAAAARPGGGSVFGFDLPFAVARRRSPEGSVRPRLAVLVVEDDEANASLTQACLHELGHVPIVVRSIRAARRRLQGARHDLVISDQRLHDATGSDLARHMRAADDPGMAGLPLILMTADVTDVAGLPPDLVQYILGKPFDREDLAQAIRHVLSPDAPSAAPSAAPADTAPGCRAPASPAAEDGPAGFDPHRLEQMLADLGPQRCGRIVDSYLGTAAALAAEFSRDTAPRDLSALGGSAHKLASAASVVGLTALAQRARRLVARCKAGNRAQIAREVAELRADIERSCRDLSGFRRRCMPEDGAEA